MWHQDVIHLVSVKNVECERKVVCYHIAIMHCMDPYIATYVPSERTHTITEQYLLFYYFSH